MKTLIALTLVGLLAFVGCSESDTTTDAAITDASHRIEASVSGMDCGGCTSQVCAAVEQVPGVAGAAADLETGKVTVALKEGVDAEAAKAEIEEVIAGLSDGKYTVGGIETIAPEGKATSETEGSDQAQEPSEDAQAGTIEDNPAYVTYSYKVAGMDCTGCSGEIEDAIKRVAGVNRVKADHNDGTVVVGFDKNIDNKRASDEVKQLVASLGGGKYTITN